MSSVAHFACAMLVTVPAAISPVAAAAAFSPSIDRALDALRLASSARTIRLSCKYLVRECIVNALAARSVERELSLLELKSLQSVLNDYVADDNASSSCVFEPGVVV